MVNKVVTTSWEYNVAKMVHLELYISYCLHLHLCI